MPEFYREYSMAALDGGMPKCLMMAETSRSA
jgi:hypothetical protein